MIEDSEYQLTPLREEADFVYYRGVEYAGQAPVLAVMIAPDGITPRCTRRLEHEYSLAAELDNSWAARPLALTRHGGQLVLILKDPGGVPLDRVIAQSARRPSELGRLLRIAIGLAAALGQAHRQGLIHKDIKPANVLVDESGRAWLTGFGIATRLSREHQSLAAPECIDGSLPYMAPEQTGRMNRSVDSRSDLYALGVTLYEMFTGELPFTASDPMEWVHCQIARQPQSPTERSPTIPVAVSAIILKLLTKTAEERYQTAAGVEYDLQWCLAEWEARGKIDEFVPGARDHSDRLLIPEKLYGREAEVATLLGSFDRIVRGGRPELILVSGYSGIGKSSVVNELHKALVPPRGLFASGKFEQYKRDIPYATLSQALQNLIHPLLTKDEAELARWRKTINEALSPNGRLLIDLAPDLKLIIGEQPEVPDLPSRDAQNRFQLVFRQFIGIFTQDCPLTLFLDDLQWVDAATMDLLEHLLTREDVKGLLLIGAYRDNEVDQAHLLMRKQESMLQAGATVRNIILAPLVREDIEQLIADTLHLSTDRAKPLAAIVEEKTGGNPFFAIQFLTALFDEQLLHFDHHKGRWTWDLSGIRGKGYTENVVDLMLEKLGRLPLDAQKSMQQLACLGNTANFAILQAVCEATEQEIHAMFWEATRAGLVLRAENSYRFLHDKVQEAAYLLIPQDLRAEAHLRIGRLMAAHVSDDRLHEEIFEIVNQINRGLHLIHDCACCRRVAELNLMAAKRAKASTAYESALKYLHAGRALLSQSAWHDDYDLILAIELLIAECELHTAELVGAESRLFMLAGLARSNHDLAVITRLQLTLYTTLDRSDRAIDVFLDYLRREGTDWPRHPSRDVVAQEYAQLWEKIGTKRIEDLIDLPLIEDASVLDMLDVLTEIVHPAMFFDENLSTLVVCRMVALCLKHGNCDAASFGYVWLGMFAGPRFNHYEAAFRFGQLGYDLVEKRGLVRYQARTYLSFATLLPWSRHAAKARELIRRAFDVAFRTGDLTFSAYSWHALITNYLAVGDPLSDVLVEVEKGLAFAKKSGFGLVAENCGAQLGLIRTLRGLTSTFGSFDSDGYTEAETELRLARNPLLVLAEFFYWTRKMQARFFSGDYASAVDASQKAHRLLWPAASQVETGDFRFYAALSHAAAWRSAAPEAKERHVIALGEHQRQLKVWASHCPANFEAKATLVEAEIARIEGRIADAEHAYEQSISSAHDNGFVHCEAVACECAAQFFASRGLARIAKLYLREARACFQRWGAAGKIKQLDSTYPSLREKLHDTHSTALHASDDPLDIESFVKASQAISSEIVLPKLIERLIRIAMENAGADRGILILLKGGTHSTEPMIQAEGLTGRGHIDVVMREAKVTSSELPVSLLHYVIRTHERVLLEDAYSDDTYAKDDYVQRRQLRSVLCLPIVKQAEIVGALYLENNLASGAFTPERVAILELLASQAAISLENATLYTDLRRSEAFLAQGQRISRTGTFGWNATSGQIYWSEEDYKILEYDQHVQASVELALQRIHPDDRELVRRKLEAALLEGTNFESEHRLLMPDGRVKHVQVTGRAMTAGGLDYVGAVRDVTQQVQAEETLRQAQAELAYVSRVATLNAMTASIGHEVSQPLSGILTNAYTCLRMLGADPPNVIGAVETVRRTIRDADRATDVIKRLRAMFSKNPPARETLDLNEVAKEAVALSSSELKKRGSLLRVNLADDLPLIKADRVQIQQVILNLLLNGADAMVDIESRSRDLLVRTSRADSGAVTLSVLDTGIGVDSGSIEKLFDAFYTTKKNGMGVGLAICRSIIEAHGGRIWGEPNIGAGAIFSFSIPPHEATDHTDRLRA